MFFDSLQNKIKKNINPKLTKIRLYLKTEITNIQNNSKKKTKQKAKTSYKQPSHPQLLENSQLTLLEEWRG